MAAAHRRTAVSDTALAVVLAFVAGAVNAGGFLAIGQYTSHMTGIVSAIADSIVLRSSGIIGLGILSIFAFIAGASASAILINWSRQNDPKRQYAYPIVLEALLLLFFAVFGFLFQNFSYPSVLALPLLCFLMGLQNATITKLSGARIRTTHVTGMVTDIGIELGKLAYFHHRRRAPGHIGVLSDQRKLLLLTSLIATFLVGGISGGLGFSVFGAVFCLPLAILLFLVAYPQLHRRPSVP